MAQQKDMTIDDTSGKPKRNLHYWAIGLFAFATAVFLLLSSNEKNKPQAETPPPAPIESDTNSQTRKEAIAGLIKTQEDAAKPPQYTNQPGTPYNIPSVATQGVAIDSANGSSTTSEPTKEEVALKQKEAERMTSPILAIDATQAPLMSDQANGSQSGVISPATFQKQVENIASADKSTEDKVLSAAINAQKDLNASAQLAAQNQQNQSNVTAAPSVVLDRQWSDQQTKNQQSTQKVIEDSQNPDYTIFQGSVIPAVLISRINSDLPGDLIAQTTEDIYDGVHGDHLIIPKGSRVYGVYNNDINTGQSKVMVAFQRIVLPGGRSITLPGLPGMDSIGQTGVTGDVDNHFLKLYGGSSLVAAFGAIVDYYGKNNTNVSSSPTGNSGYGLGTQVTSATGQVLVQMSNNMLQRNNSIRPTVTVDQGTKMNIFVKRDFQVKPY